MCISGLAWSVLLIVIDNVQSLILWLLSFLTMLSSVQFSSFQSCLILQPTDCSMSGFPVPTISFSAIPFSYHLQSFPASGSFPMSRFFASGGQSIGASAGASVLPMNIQNKLPIGLTGWISLQSKGLSRVFSNTTVQKHQFFSSQLSL